MRTKKDIDIEYPPDFDGPGAGTILWIGEIGVFADGGCCGGDEFGEPTAFIKCICHMYNARKFFQKKPSNMKKLFTHLFYKILNQRLVGVYNKNAPAPWLEGGKETANIHLEEIRQNVMSTRM